jgi:hypothetical protein
MFKHLLGITTLLLISLMTMHVYAQNNLFANGDLQTGSVMQADHWGLKTDKMRCNGIQRGDKQGFVTGTLFVQCMDTAGKKMKTDIKGVPRVDGTLEQWEEKTVDMVVPEGIQKLQVMPVLFNVKAGTMDFDDYKLEIIE